MLIFCCDVRDLRPPGRRGPRRGGSGGDARIGAPAAARGRAARPEPPSLRRARGDGWPERVFEVLPQPRAVAQHAGGVRLRPGPALSLRWAGERGRPPREGDGSPHGPASTAIRARAYADDLRRAIRRIEGAVLSAWPPAPPKYGPGRRIVDRRAGRRRPSQFCHHGTGASRWRHARASRRGAARALRAEGAAVAVRALPPTPRRWGSWPRNGTYAFLVGVGFIEGRLASWCSTSCATTRGAALAAVARAGSAASGLVTFNGADSNLPLLETRSPWGLGAAGLAPVLARRSAPFLPRAAGARSAGLLGWACSSALPLAPPALGRRRAGIMIRLLLRPSCAGEPCRPACPGSPRSARHPGAGRLLAGRRSPARTVLMDGRLRGSGWAAVEAHRPERAAACSRVLRRGLPRAER